MKNLRRLDCESTNSARASLSAFSGLRSQELLAEFDEFSKSADNELASCERWQALADWLSVPRDSFEVRWFHGTRTANSESFLENGITSGSPRLETTNATQPQISLRRWRGAEQQVLALLAARGWKVEDVSRQNIGYDIEAHTPEGEDLCVEVKSLDYPGQPFNLTSNEEAVARQKGRAYRLVLVRQTNTHIEIAFIADPINQLQLTRQCRQWVWECATYDFTPDRFVLE